MPEAVALITGASRGIGRAVAIALARRGHPVAINFLSDAEQAKETLRLAEETGAAGLCVQADVGDSSEVDRCFSYVEDVLGPVGVLINNAGIRADGLAMRMTDEDWDRVIRTNLFGTFACCRRALRPMLRAGKGRIVNITSVAGMRGSPGQTNYSAAKAGVIGLTRTLARETAKKGITVNAVAPGLVATDLTADLNDEQRAVFTSQVPSGRAGTPEDIAGVVAFLCSEEASYVTGGLFTADGGLTA